MVGAGADVEARSASTSPPDGTLLGKRYVDEDSNLEVLCTKAGSGPLSVGKVPMQRKDAKPLPSSD